MACHYCGRTRFADGCCTKEHFVCNRCHQENGLEVIKSICTTTKEQDLIGLLKLIRSHPSIPMHGPEHHAMIPGILLACYRNCGGAISSKEILTAINRGADVPGGVCGFWGACGAAIGIGIGIATIFFGNTADAWTASTGSGILRQNPYGPCRMQRRPLLSA